MFLTPDQRRRKEALKKDQAKKRMDIDAAQKLRRDRAQRDSWAEETPMPSTNTASIKNASSLPSNSSSSQAEVISLVGGGGGDRSLKRPRVMASIFDKPSRQPQQAGGAGGGGEGRKRWKAMPAPFPVSCRHLEVMARGDEGRAGGGSVDGDGDEGGDRGGDEGGGGGAGGTIGCVPCAEEQKAILSASSSPSFSLLLTPGVVMAPGGLPPLPSKKASVDWPETPSSIEPIVEEAGGGRGRGARGTARGGRRRVRGSGRGKGRGKSGAEGGGGGGKADPTAAEAEAWKAAAAASKATRSVGSPSKDDTYVHPGVRPRGFLPSPAALLFLGSGVAKGGGGGAVDEDGGGGGGGGIGNGRRAESAGKVPITMDEQAVVVPGGVEGGDGVVMSAARRARMKMTARARRTETAPDALWTEVRDGACQGRS